MAPRTKGLLVHDQPNSVYAESIRVLRTNLQYVTLNGRLKSLLVTSAAPNEGKTSIAANLAVSYGMARLETIVVGVDLRKPTIHQYFNVDNSIGLTSAIVGQAQIDDIIFPTDVPGLSIVPSGPIPPNPAEMLGSDAIKDILADLDSRADIIILDGPPVLAVTDAVLLSTQVSGTLLVVNIGSTSREMVKLANDHLKKVNANVIGVVANRVGSRGSYYYYYEYAEDPEPRRMLKAVDGSGGPSKPKDQEPKIRQMKVKDDG